MNTMLAGLMHLAHLKELWCLRTVTQKLLGIFSMSVSYVLIQAGLAASLLERVYYQVNLSYIWNREDCISFQMGIQVFLDFPQH